METVILEKIESNSIECQYKFRCNKSKIARHKNILYNTRYAKQKEKEHKLKPLFGSKAMILNYLYVQLPLSV